MARSDFNRSREPNRAVAWFPTNLPIPGTFSARSASASLQPESGQPRPLGSSAHRQPPNDVSVTALRMPVYELETFITRKRASSFPNAGRSRGPEAA